MKQSQGNLRAKIFTKRQQVIAMAKPIIEEDEIEAVTTVLKSGVLAQGRKVEEFEEAFAEFSGTRYAIAFNSGTAALHIALLTHGIGEGDEVITSPFTFISTANSILFTGAKPVFADIEEETFNISPDSIAQKITPRTKAIMPVHLYGQPCDMRSLMKIADEHGLIVIEDACQAHGAEYDGNKVGSFGTGCFSFYPTKNMTTGEGGMITTNNKNIAEKARIIRNHGQKERYFHEILGYNYRMTDFVAAIGYCQLRKLEQFNQKRTGNAKILTEGLGEIRGLIPPYVKPNVKHVFHQYTVRVTNDFGISREELMVKLINKGVATKIYYPLPIHKQPLYQKLGYNDYLPNSEKAATEVLSLPVHPSLARGELDYIVESLISCRDD
jgi:dTDP-4-amino-4,6-dideoxygalactose transaminase